MNSVALNLLTDQELNRIVESPDQFTDGEAYEAQQELEQRADARTALLYSLTKSERTMLRDALTTYQATLVECLNDPDVDEPEDFKNTLEFATRLVEKLQEH